MVGLELISDASEHDKNKTPKCLFNEITYSARRVIHLKVIEMFYVNVAHQLWIQNQQFRVSTFKHSDETVLFLVFPIYCSIVERNVV